MLIGDPASNVAAVALIRAAITDDKDSGVLILSQNGLLHDQQTSAMGMSLAAVAARALMTGFGYNVEQALRTLEAWSAEYTREVSSGSNRDSGA
jgi:hypothetical protein